MSKPKVVLAETSADKMGEHATGSWWEEITTPYYQFINAGVEVTIASVKGGKVPVDKNSEGMPGEFDDKFRAEHSDLLEKTVALSAINPADYDGIFFSGGHGTCVDFPRGAKAAVEGFWNAGKFVAAVCHGPCCLLEAEVDGAKLLKGRRCTGFSDIEEDAVQLTALVTEITGGSLATLMKNAGGLYEDNGTMWTPNCVRDGRLITGQNPQSSKCTADALIAAIKGN